ncbi:hypothetical protein B0A69_11710 [Chryseobacterium shigense]|uniref:Tetratricopeptide repeat-containing protein n=1 Tax=Chryseobacterium shigense TaxID=297244 RepID=A0A1N7J4X7_9FLAO|nr:hypothetical protein [Chryseobacterium shigense]PQA93661.1 hypothetical protein B0A69_11710 [Chryseobacterium shigense]SIS44364.1 hypothetical protein SAMN05421639_105108 [Chryseobacterium shigense]
MNPRVLELLKNPKNIQSEDLGLLKEEIHAFPYVQNIRALHLFGVHLYDKENYQKELSTTAAYTTDKKLLYQLINGKIQREPKPEVIEDKKTSKTIEKEAKYSYKDKAFPIKRDQPSEKEQTKYEEAASMMPPVQEIRHIHVNGERNRILFEGEENFLEETNSEIIDLESTLESGVIVTQKTETAAKDLQEEGVQVEETKKSKQEEESEVGAEFTPELIVDENSIDSQPEEQEINKDEDVSFHGVETENNDKNNSETGAEFTPELIVDENNIDSQPEEQKIDKDEDVSFHEVETITPDPEVKEGEKQQEKVEESGVAENDQDLAIVAKDESTAEPDAEISFHGLDQFLPDVKIQGNSDDKAVASEVSKPNVNKHEEEMRRLIEEVEKKMKEAHSTPKDEGQEPETADHEISFAETQNFHFWSTEKEESKAEESVPEPIEDSAIQSESLEEPLQAEQKADEKESISQEVSAWKPMSLESNLPDSMISKETKENLSNTETPKQQAVPAAKDDHEETAAQAPEAPQKDIQTALGDSSQLVVEEMPEQLTIEEAEEVKSSEESTETKTHRGEEAPVMNVSFFGTDISSLSVQKAEKEKTIEDPVQEVKAPNTAKTADDSNVPGFINTWQSWLKIDRPVEEEAIAEKKVQEAPIPPVQEKVIEAFIENNPKISQLRDESTYVVREKNDDISHLMTETLANLYFEQKLYTKAIKAFEILIKKTPEKKEHFQSKIKEIKDFRSKS